jgi:hypothetical protein
MHESYREYVNFHGRRFLIIIFEDHHRSLLKIFLNRELIYQVPVQELSKVPTDPKAAATNPFSGVTNEARQWIGQHY